MPLIEIVGVTPGQIATIAASFFFVMWIATALKGRKPRERRYYTTDIPSTLHIEREA